MTVKRSQAESIVGFLSFSNASNDCAAAIEKFTPRQWEHMLLWLDDTGLAFYFLQKLKETNSTAIVPSSVLTQLEHNFASNDARVEAMSSRFSAINKRFNDAGVRYAVVKGFSLVPEFCPGTSLRYQADFDYLISEESLAVARRVLSEAEYDSRNSVSSKEFIFVTPGAKPRRGDAQYSPQAPHAVELHTDLWDSEMHGLESIPRLFSVDNARIRHWNGFSFPAQTDADAFLLQVLHACRHVFTQWIRLSNLFEISYFLNRRWSDTNFWREIDERIGENTIVREFVVIVAELARQLFAAPFPRLLHDWAAGIRRKPRVWIQRYARDWALSELPAYEFCLFPRSKLVLFLQQQYLNPSGEMEATQENNAPSSRSSLRPLRITSALRLKPSLLLSGEWRQTNRLIRRSVFYALAQTRYLCEIPRWRWLTRTSASR
jgi:hypothetical protein